MRSRIVGTGRAVPTKTLTNEDLSRMVDTSDSWIVEHTGWRAIDELERAAGEPLGRPRVKLRTWHDLLSHGRSS